MPTHFDPKGNVVYWKSASKIDTCFGSKHTLNSQHAAPLPPHATSVCRLRRVGSARPHATSVCRLRRVGSARPQRGKGRCARAAHGQVHESSRESSKAQYEKDVDLQSTFLPCALRTRVGIHRPSSWFSPLLCSLGWYLPPCSWFLPLLAHPGRALLSGYLCPRCPALVLTPCSVPVLCFPCSVSAR